MEITVDMVDDNLIAQYEEKIERPVIRNKIAFLKCGINGDFGKIRKIIDFKNPEGDKVNALISICDNRLDRLNSFAGNITTFVSFVLATFTLSITLVFDKIIDDKNVMFPRLEWFFGQQVYLLWKILMVFLLILGILFLLLLFRNKAHANAWYAIKEDLLLYKLCR